MEQILKCRCHALFVALDPQFNVASVHRMVHAGQHEGLFYSLGYSGHGVQMATYMGRQMAEVLSGNEDANPWRDLPFKRIPGHVGPPWFLPFAGAYYNAMDRIK